MLTPGMRLGPYEIAAPLGAGGMGKVFRARDTKLNRDVAIQVLPAAFAQDTERVARFRREAQLLASLNHPNIAAIHVRASSGPRALLWFLALVLALVSLALWAPWSPAPEPAPPLRLNVGSGTDASISAEFGPAAVLSPDGRLLAFVASLGAEGRSRLYLRRLEQLDAAPLSETEGACDPFFSPVEVRSRWRFRHLDLRSSLDSV